MRPRPHIQTLALTLAHPLVQILAQGQTRVRTKVQVLPPVGLQSRAPCWWWCWSVFSLVCWVQRCQHWASLGSTSLLCLVGACCRLLCCTLWPAWDMLCWDSSLRVHLAVVCGLLWLCTRYSTT
jgi:hypothetical protein